MNVFITTNSTWRSNGSSNRPNNGWLLLTILAFLPLFAAGQHLESIGVATSLNVTQTIADPSIISLPGYTIATTADGSRYDDIGYRLTAYARWQVSQPRFFLQPEVSYTSTVGQAYLVFYDAMPISLGPYWFTFSHAIRRLEVAALGGIHTSRHTYVLLGPVLSFNQRQTPLPEKPGSYPASAQIFNSLYQSVEPIQALAQVGIGFIAGRFDFNLRLEQSLSPYSRRFTFDGNTYGYRQQIRQGLFTAGILLYKRKAQPLPLHQ